ncbi:hypothetical protein L226DRAFT_361917 [Lentinus tigrinus ALCF2SS1-7]|uniref:uncharacterized protein n=1 Tax=Lentinus tigrinus ALCF2SS1-7 TaxID=1328758 RepID=UPI0011660800|nr:hypothetical protein L226DRAFT_361917 [Lentinus tigrinus ALCF2SS1-7]
MGPKREQVDSFCTVGRRRRCSSLRTSIASFVLACAGFSTLQLIDTRSPNRLGGLACAHPQCANLSSQRCDTPPEAAPPWKPSICGGLLLPDSRTSLRDCSPRRAHRRRNSGGGGRCIPSSKMNPSLRTHFTHPEPRSPRKTSSRSREAAAAPFSRPSSSPSPVVLACSSRSSPRTAPATPVFSERRAKPLVRELPAPPHAPPNSLPLSVCASVRLPVSNFHSASSSCCCCATPAEPRLAPCATELAVHLLLLVPLLPFALAHGWRAIYDVSPRCADPWAAAGHSHSVCTQLHRQRHTPTAIPIPDPEVPEAQKTEKPTALGPVSLHGMSNRMCWGPAIDRLLLPTLPTRSLSRACAFILENMHIFTRINARPQRRCTSRRRSLSSFGPLRIRVRVRVACKVQPAACTPSRTHSGSHLTLRRTNTFRMRLASLDGTHNHAVLSIPERQGRTQYLLFRTQNTLLSRVSHGVPFSSSKEHTARSRESQAVRASRPRCNSTLP